MEIKSDDTSTPVRSGRKTLGLRKSISRNQLNRTPLSDVKKNEIINYLKSDSHQIQSPKTPVTGLKSLKLDGSNSSNSLRNSSSSFYKLSLSKTAMTRNKKKKLDFFSHKSEESMEVSSKECSPLRNLPKSPQIENVTSIKLNLNDDITVCNSSNLKSLNDDELEDEIQKKARILEDIKKHEEKVDELENLISLWTNGFCDSFVDLKNKTGIHSDEVLLDQLHLPRELLKYCK